MFPADALVASGGAIRSHLFENPQAGVPRGVYWSVGLDFQPLEYQGKEWECSMSCEWLTWPGRDWRDLAGLELDLVEQDEGPESGFYMWQHDVGTATRLRIGARDGDRFELSMDMVVEFSGYTGADGDPAMRVRGTAGVPYTGIAVVPENLSPAPATPADVTAALAPFLDPSLYTSPARQGNTYWLHPLPGL
jgi:hypothetical protein